MDDTQIAPPFFGAHQAIRTLPDRPTVHAFTDAVAQLAACLVAAHRMDMDRAIGIAYGSIVEHLKTEHPDVLAKIVEEDAEAAR